jgi:hypothetical protein
MVLQFAKTPHLLTFKKAMNLLFERFYHSRVFIHEAFVL